jgi:hypothetical protein
VGQHWPADRIVGVRYLSKPPSAPKDGDVSAKGGDKVAKLVEKKGEGERARLTKKQKLLKEIGRGHFWEVGEVKRTNGKVRAWILHGIRSRFPSHNNTHINHGMWSI